MVAIIYKLCGKATMLACCRAEHTSAEGPIALTLLAREDGTPGANFQGGVDGATFPGSGGSLAESISLMRVSISLQASDVRNVVVKHSAFSNLSTYSIMTSSRGKHSDCESCQGWHK